jgi:branched-chain amino acid transport system permease protein
MRSLVVARGGAVHRAYQAAGAAAAALFLLLAPVLLEDYQVTLLGQALAYAVALLGLTLVTGISGQISLGHGAMFGIGAYTTAILVSDHGVPFPVALAASAGIGIVFGVVIGLPALRLSGLYLAIVTITAATAFPLVVVQPFAQELGTGGSSGKPVALDWGKPSWFVLDVTPVGFRFTLVGAVCAVVFALTGMLVRGRVGRAMTAVRDNPTAAAAAGIHLAQVKVGAFAFSTMLAGIGGSLFMLMVPIVSPDSVGFPLSLLFITAMIIGGAARVAGALVGGFVMVFLPFLTSELALRVPVLADLPQPGLLATVIYGVVLVLCIFFLPQGVMPLVTAQRERLLRFVPPGVHARPAHGRPAVGRTAGAGQPAPR